MRVVVSGSRGLIGSALVRALREAGDEVVRLVRREPSGPGEARWDPMGGMVDTGALQDAHAVVHLAAAGVGDRPWTHARKRLIRESRIRGTRTLAGAIADTAKAGGGPRVFVSGSAIGYYGDTGGREVDESSGMGEGFLAELVRDWEAATGAAADAGVRVAHSRTSLVLARSGGLLGKQLPLFRLGLGGRLGSGRQWMSWITLDDTVAALRHLIARDDLAGPVNLTAPHPVTNAEYTKAVGRVLHRPTVLPVPAFALRAALLGFADEGPLISQKVRPGRLEESGFAFAHPRLDGALRAVLERD
ncbi:TIGR01777 family oxidoreductase [Actinomadura sp. NBRC 104412]|uniref:TIGR01777 family oxidoreductase n=1 Tax=Actinomadura sp. NBRC 104412 TaxID=3032203 RepID=UPI00255335F1|nr:TIGR01777 family oxidoreductase [Actinomadura sp. NBRC 104412]